MGPMEEEAAAPSAVPTDTVWILNSLLFLVGGFLVFFMAAGFAMLMRSHVIALFSLFGIKSLLETEDDDGAIDEKPGHTVFITTFLMIFVAELGDKTQLTIAALAAAHQPISVYIGATLALAATTLIGIIGGRWVTQHISTTTLHRVSGGLFLAFAAWTTYTLF